MQNYIYSYGVSYKGSGFYIGISKNQPLYTKAKHKTKDYS